MPQIVTVSSVENIDKIKTKLVDLFKTGKYPEITQSIGIHSILIDAEHTLSDQAGLYRIVLNLLKDRIGKNAGKAYGQWYENFPNLMDKLISSKTIVTDAASLDVLSSHREAYGPFKSVDHFFFWALDDRRLTLAQIVKYIEKTAAK